MIHRNFLHLFDLHIIDFSLLFLCYIFLDNIYDKFKNLNFFYKGHIIKTLK